MTVCTGMKMHSKKAPHMLTHLCATDTKWENMTSAMYTDNENRDTPSH